MPILKDSFTTINEVNDLLKLGYISSITRETKDNINIIAYTRDRCEEIKKSLKFSDLDELEKQAKSSIAEYVYIFNEDTNKWTYKEKSYKV